MKQETVIHAANPGAALYRPLLLGSTMALVMSLVMTFYSTAVNFGFGQDFVARWLCAFAMGYAVAAPTAILLSTHVARLVNRVLLPAKEF
jgi:Na+/glutamate symporter